MIGRQKAKYGGEFLFLGANIDAVETASQFGIGADRAVNYQCDSEGTALNYEVISEAISSVRCSAPLSADWKKRIDEDYKKRGGRRQRQMIFESRGDVIIHSGFFARTGTEWRLPQQEENRFRVTKIMLVKERKML